MHTPSRAIVEHFRTTNILYDAPHDTSKEYSHSFNLLFSSLLLSCTFLSQVKFEFIARQSCIPTRNTDTLAVVHLAEYSTEIWASYQLSSPTGELLYNTFWTETRCPYCQVATTPSRATRHQYAARRGMLTPLLRQARAHPCYRLVHSGNLERHVQCRPCAFEIAVYPTISAIDAHNTRRH